MRNYKLIILLSLILSLFSIHTHLGYARIEANPIGKSALNLEDFYNTIETAREFELKYNKVFQEDLKNKSKVYYASLVESFIDEETGFFKLFGEMWNVCFQSENQRELLWKLKIESYFKTASYLSFIRNEVEIYTDGVNLQRNSGISKILRANSSSNIKLPILNANSFITDSNSVRKIIDKISSEVNDQLADTVLGFSVEIILAILGLFGILKGFKVHWSIPIIICLICLGLFIWRSNVRQGEIRNILKIEYEKVLNSSNIDYLIQLNNNTNNYYNQLEKISNETTK